MATKALAALTVDLVGRGDQLRAEFAKSTAQSKTWGANMRKQVNSSAKAFAGMGIAAGAAAIGGMAMLYAQSSKTEDALGKLSDRLGETPERITALRHAAELTGTSADKLDVSMEKLAKNVGEAKNGFGTAKDYLERFGLANEAFYKLSPADQFAAISDKVKGLSSQQEKAAASAALFGKSGQSLVTMMELGSEGLAAMDAEVEALGLSLSRLEIAKIEQANDAIFEGQQLVGTFGKHLTAELAPIVTAIATQFKKAAVEAGGFGQLAFKAVDGVLKPIYFVSDAVAGIGRVFSVVADGIVSYIAYITTGFTKLAKNALLLASYIPGINFSGTIDSLQEFEDQSAFVMNAAMDNISETINRPMPSEALKGWVQNARESADEAAQAAISADGKKTNTIIQNLSRVDEAQAKAAAKEQARIQSENEKLLAGHRSRFEESVNQRLQAEGKFEELEKRRFEKQQADFETEKQAMIERGLETEEIREQLRIMEENAEITHSQNLKNIADERHAAQMEGMRLAFEGASQMFGELGELTKAFGNEQSGAYKVMFAASKGFAVAEAAVKIQQGIAQAWSLGFPAGIPASMAVIGATAGLVSTIRGTNYAGAYADGGVIPGSSYTGDKMMASVNSGEMVLNQQQQSQLFGMANGQGGGAGGAVVNLRIVNLFDAALIADYMATTEGEEVVLNVVRENPELMKQLVA